MHNIGSFIFSSSYSAAYPGMNALSAVCSVNGISSTCFDGAIGAFVALFAGIWFLWFAVIVLMFVAMWKVFVKAGKPGWAAIIPIYNIVVMLEIVGKPIWWVILFFIPFVGTIMSIIVIHNFSLSFGKGIGFTLGLLFLPFVFIPILAFGNSTYQGGGGSMGMPVQQPAM